MSKQIAYIVGIAFTVFNLAALVVFALPPWVHLSGCLGFAIVLTFLLKPGPFGSARNPVNILWSVTIGGSALVALFHYATEFETMLYRITVTPSPMDIFSSIALAVACLEICRRTTGWGLTIVALVFIAYGLWGNIIPGAMGHKGFSAVRLFTRLYNDAGIFGTPLDAACTYVFLFIVFGEFLNKFGGGDAFMDLATGVAGQYRGGPAKVAVVSSALFGTISGSSIANVAATGAFTIPLMKRVGYRPAFAGAVEAAASTGGQIMPPVMGATAFILAEMVGVPYATVAMKCTVPAILYFFAVMIMVDCEAARSKLRGIPKDELPDVKNVLLRRWPYLVPLIVIFAALLGFGVSTSRAALCGIVATLLVPLVAPGAQVTARKCCDAMAEGAVSILSIIAACAVAGIVIGVLGITGLGGKIGVFLLAVSGGHVLPMLITGMILSIILGMGLPSAAAYIIAASVVGPPLTLAGLPMLNVHLFICYYAVLSVVTPPVALASYTAAGIAGANANIVGLEAFRLTIAGFLVPYMFIYSPAIILEGQLLEVIWATITAIMGIIFLGCGVQRFWFSNLNFLQSGMLIIAAVCTIYSGIKTDILGFILVVVALLAFPSTRQEILAFWTRQKERMRIEA